MGEFRMPALGAEMTEGRLDQWLVKPGDTVHRGDLIAVVETDKAAIEVEVWQDGTVEELLVEEGTKVPVGTPLAVLGDGVVEREAGPSEASEVEEPAAELEVREPGIGIREIEREVAAGPSVRGPLARHRADELGVDLAAVHGTGPGGAITRHDVEAAGRTVTGRAPSPEREGGARPRVSPYARRLAAEQGVDVATVTGSGPGGAIVARDLEGRPAAPGDA
ncbi:MAG: E3 binding domain-containing protein, partial [Nitriliruptorales bacterium]|nr:E3 binding domain-containing protein [Nitriliruptorales bacterium]